MAPDVGEIKTLDKLPVEAGLLIFQETKNYVFKGKPESFSLKLRPHEFSLGEALEKASEQVFSQVFKNIKLIRTFQEAKKYRIIIEPRIEDFHFRYDTISYAGFAYAAISKMSVHVTIVGGETHIWEKSSESPEQIKGPWVFDPRDGKYVGEAASDALVFTLRKMALEITEDASIKQFIDKNP